ncbi:MAG: PAS domain S-box protein, partial [Magnetospirillum sp.]|nr:PAS domain S-box protein [Magnetospirillum sp.]
MAWLFLQSPAWADVTNLLSDTLNDHNSIMLLIEPESGAIIDANDAAAHFYGYSLAQLKGMKIQDINTLGPDEVGAERRKAKAEKRNYFIFPHRLASGELKTVEVYSAPVRDNVGRPLLLSIIHDITGKAVAEQELTAYRTRLEELVTRRTAEAMDAQSRLRFWMGLGLALQTVLIVALVIAVIRRHSAVKEVAHEALTRRRAEEKLAQANADLQRFAEIAAHHLQEPTRRLM